MTRRTPPPDRRTARRPIPSWEPPLQEMLADPVVQAMMRVDGVQPTEVVSLLRAAKERLDAPDLAR